MKKKKLIVLIIIGIVVFFICATLLYRGCQAIFRTDYKEIQRASSPSHMYDVVFVLEMSGGAAGSVSQEVYLVNHAENIQYGELIFNSVHLESIKISWQNDSTIVIKYKKDIGRLLRKLDTITMRNSSGNSRKFNLLVIPL